MNNKRTAPGSHRATMTLTVDEYERLQYFAAKHEMSINEYLHESFLHMVDYENGVYDIPTITQERMNLVVDAVTMNSSKIDSLAEFITGGFESLLAAARGDDYIHLRDDDDDDSTIQTENDTDENSAFSLENEME